MRQQPGVARGQLRTNDVHRPDFIIGGAPRSGTTWLYRVLDSHPQIHMAKPERPEPKFFLIDAEFEKGIDHYLHTWFSGVPERAIAGEKSTNYLESRVAAERIHDCFPDVKLIFMLREPADRAMSNWRWTQMNGLETLPFAEAIRREPEREAAYPDEHRYSRPYSYFSRGLYHRMLEPYLELFPRENVVCLRYEDILNNRGRLIVLVHEFLDVEQRPADVNGIGAVNPSTPIECDLEALQALRKRYEQPNRELAGLLGAGFEIWDS